MWRKLFLISILNLVLFLFIYFALQHYTVYTHTLGKVSQNYQRFGDWQNPDIRRVSQPYIAITNDNFENWDAAIYKCIKQTMYSDTGCYNKIKGAFFPLFPIIWKISSLNNIGISVFNYLLFTLSIALLLIHFLKTDDTGKLFIYSLCISLPSVIVYYIPYTESLFLFCMALTVLGLEKNKYYLYFIPALLLAMVRPATIFVLIAFLVIESVQFITTRNIKMFFKNSALKTAPFALGYLLVIFIQFLSSSSWATFLNAGTYWSGGAIHKITGISDWSAEGFGLSSFSIFFICIPAIVYLAYTLINSTARVQNYAAGEVQKNDSYIFLVSLVYLSAMLVFTLLTSGGNFHSFSRFILNSPLFYLALIFLLNHLTALNKNIILLLWAIPLCLLIGFLFSVGFGGSRFDFSYTGLYLYILLYLFFLFRNRLSFRAQLFICAILILSSTVWNTYLLNMFFNQAWIFT
ncbi:MAG TPA: hypothetical protein VK783_15805 [Bacteroidia bacterium]|jgi:hypothetical protein|nr:hypothetical protein [Bacteroidia bacterium]